MHEHFRHGDILIRRIAAIPTGAESTSSKVVAEGEATGHAHRLTGDGEIFAGPSGMFLRISGPSSLVHEEHATIDLPVGDYAIDHQVEYDPYAEAARRVAD